MEICISYQLLEPIKADAWNCSVYPLRLKYEISLVDDIAFTDFECSLIALPSTRRRIWV